MVLLRGLDYYLPHCLAKVPPMKEARIDLFRTLGKVDWACITTNGEIKRDGRAVMGRGIAEQAKTRWPGIDLVLANGIRTRGNVPNFLGYVDKFLRWTPSDPSLDLKQTLLWSFPTKHNWRDKSDMDLIIQSARALVQEAVNFPDIEIVLPRPGCSNGGLNWVYVHKYLARHLDDRFTIVTNENLKDVSDEEANNMIHWLGSICGMARSCGLEDELMSELKIPYEQWASAGSNDRTTFERVSILAEKWNERLFSFAGAR